MGATCTTRAVRAGSTDTRFLWQCNRPFPYFFSAVLVGADVLVPFCHVFPIIDIAFSYLDRLHVSTRNFLPRYFTIAVSLALKAYGERHCINYFAYLIQCTLEEFYTMEIAMCQLLGWHLIQLGEPDTLGGGTLRND
jgi:hypothetical protein